MGIFKDMKIYDSDGNTGIIKNVSGDNIDIVFEKIIKVTFNNLKDTELQKNHQSVRLKTDDIGTKIFFDIEDSLLTYDEIIKKEKYQTYIGSILRNSEKKQKTLMEEKQKRAPDLPVLSPDLLKRLKHEYLSKQKSMNQKKRILNKLVHGEFYIKEIWIVHILLEWILTWHTMMFRTMKNFTLGKKQFT